MSDSNRPSTLFQSSSATLPPLAERMRPRTLAEFVGHEDLMGTGHILHTAISSSQLFSMILWGPPGSGKTTLAKLLAAGSDVLFFELTAVSSGVRDVREILAKGRHNHEIGRSTLLFIDEIHRFNKNQQDALLHSVEDGSIILVGATTENPGFEVISPLLSRCRIIRLSPYTEQQLAKMLERALKEDIYLSRRSIHMVEEVQELLLGSAGGDARKMFNVLEIAVHQHGGETDLALTRGDLEEALQQKNLLYDKAGDYHYDTISAFIKSVRGSDPDAAIYWLAVMLEGGEQPEFIARRLIILAAEDIGNADPQALPLATSGMQAVHLIGMPEGALVLAQVTTYLAAAPKSNASYRAIQSATQHIKDSGAQTVPLHLRNAATPLMSSLDYGKDYLYPHSETDHFVQANYFPEKMAPAVFYNPTGQGYEKFLRKRLKGLWSERYTD